MTVSVTLTKDEALKESRVRRLVSTVRSEGLYGKRLAPEDIAKLGTVLLTGLCLPSQTGLAVKRSCLGLIGRTLDDEGTEELCRRIVYGEQELREYRPLVEVCLQREQIDAVCEDVQIGKQPTLIFGIRSGTLAGASRTFMCTHRFVQWFSSIVGLRTRDWRNYHPRELTGMRFRAVVEPGRDEVKLERFDVTEKQKAQNTKLRLERQKGGAECRHHCHYCHRAQKEGLRTRDSCSLATHKQVWTFQDCDNEHTERPFSVVEGCLVCREQEYTTNAGIRSFEAT